MKKILCLLLAFSLGIAFAGVKEDEDEAAQREMRQMFEKLKAVNAEKARRENVLPYPDPIVGDLKSRQEREWISDWKQGEKQRFSAFLRNAQADVLVVPFQVQANGIERANRSLMTVSLAQALSASLKVVNPYLVARALGDGERQLDPREVIQLAGQLQVKRIIWTYAGHRFDKASNRFDNRLYLYFQIQERGEQGVFTESALPPGKAIDTLEFSDTNPPIVVFRKNLPRVVEALGYQYKAPATLKADSLSKNLPASLAELTQTSLSTVNQAQYLQLLASLVPSGAERLRERLFERSLLLAWQLPAEHASVRLLTARALHGLHMRPVALALIGKAVNDDERALLAALNGNLPELDADLAKMPLSPQKLMAAIDATDIRFGYGIDTPKSLAAREKFADALPEPWKLFLVRRFADADPTRLGRFSNFELLEMLGKEFPVAGAGIQQKLRGRQIAGQSEPADMDMAIAPYLDPTVAGKSTPVCCAAANWQTERLDILDFLAQSAVANVVYKTHRLSVVQGLYQETLNYINAIDGLFGTHPKIMEAKAVAAERLAAKAEPSVKDKMLNKARLDADRAKYWQTGTEHAWSDRPNHLATPYYVRNGQAMAGHLENALAALANVSFQTNTLTASFYLTSTSAEREKMLARVAGRFSGDNTAALLQAELLKTQGKTEEAKTYLLNALKDRPMQMAIYKQLGGMLMDERKYLEAAKVFSAYPGLKGETNSLLVIDNYAYQTGSLFFWRGETDLAKGFYKISAALGTGSEGGMTSAARNATIDGDYKQAIVEQFNAAQRYGSSYRYRDYFSMLHMVGQSEAAWDGFQSLVGRFSTPHLWDSALVGHQRQGRDAKWIVNWAKQPSLNLGGRATPLTMRFLAMAMVTDRIPDKQAYQAVDAMQGGNPSERSLPSQFTEAYGALKRKDFPVAYQSLSDAGKRSKLTDPDSSYVLPYLAIAASKTGKAKEVGGLLANIPEEKRNMDYWLSLSVIEAMAGNPEATNHFRLALNTRVFTEFRPVGVEYQLSDIAEMVFELTGNPQFKDLALQVAQFTQRIQPWEAWSYAVEALLTDSASTRKTALIKAVYLDRNSERLKRVPNKELEEAAKLAQKMPPFRITPVNATKGV